MSMIHSKEELCQALTILQQECLGQFNCYECPLMKEDECAVQNKSPKNYLIHDPKDERYCAFD